MLFPETDKLPKEDALFATQENLVSRAKLKFSNYCKMRFQDLEEKYNSQLIIRIEERFNKWQFKFQQKVNLNLQELLKKYISRLEDAKKETEKAKAESEQLRKDIDEKLLKKIKQLEDTISSAIEKNEGDENELQELRFLLETYQMNLSEAESKIEQIKKKSLEEAERLVAMTIKMKELEDQNNRFKSSDTKNSSSVPVEDTAAAVNQAEDELFNNKEFVVGTREFITNINEEINTFKDVWRHFTKFGISKGFSALGIFLKKKFSKK